MRIAMIAAVLLTFSAPAAAQFGGIGGAIKKAQDAATKYDDLTFSDAEERTLGEEVSLKVRQRFGVVQNAAVHKYVSLVGLTVAKASDRPNLDWTFVVLDTDGVNAFAAPGGFVHITRGALALIRNEGELSTVLGHEIAHVTRKHTLNAIRKGKTVQLAGDAAGSRAAFLEGVTNRVYEMVLENNFDRGDEMDADKNGVQFAQKAGYAPGTLGEFLTRLSERNKDATEKNGLFASHPDTTARLGQIKKLAASSKAVALVEPRYKSNITYQPVPLSSVTTTTDAAAVAASKAKPAQKSGLSELKAGVTGEKSSTQVSASGGARGLGRDRAAKGGDNPTLVKTSVSNAELETFKKGIA
jgi:predicted Zn-dependent protease